MKPPTRFRYIGTNRIDRPHKLPSHVSFGKLIPAHHYFPKRIGHRFGIPVKPLVL